MTPAERRSRFQDCLAEHRGIVHKAARAFAPSPADAADLAQELWLQLWLALPGFAGQSKLSTWAYRVCLNTALTWRRGADRRDGPLDGAADLALLPAAGPSPAEAAGERQLLERLYQAIRAMPASDRALVLLLLDGLAYREISEITGLTENHVGVALTRARRRLAALMKGVEDGLD
jgi:RNA polymerase sigma-70 factor (ECF subfamily)